MPHARPRYLESVLRHALSHSPIVAVLGQRQTGKTTLCEGLGATYATLDLVRDLQLAEQEPERFIEDRAAPFVIDECQLAPALFPALKDRVRRLPRPGQFILTGSVRFSSRRAICESLTGRAIELELKPLSMSECHGAPLPDGLLRLLRNPERAELSRLFPERRWSRSRTLAAYLEHGGLPGICFLRDPALRAQKLEQHVSTLLDRDLRLLYPTHLPLGHLRGCLEVLATHQGQPVDVAALARGCRVSAPTMRQLLGAFEGMFLLRMLPTEGGSRKPVFFFEDQGTATHLALGRSDPSSDRVRLAFACLLPQFHYRPETASRVFQYRTRGGAFVPLAQRTRFGMLGIIPEAARGPTNAAMGSARSFLRAYRDGVVVIANDGDELARLAPRIVAVPLGRLV